jgi:hypothetical protein
VGLWGTKDRFIASDIDSGMTLILEAADIPRGEIKRVLSREEVAVQINAASNEESAVVLKAQWGRSPRRGMLLDAYWLERRLGRGHSAEVWKAELIRRLPGLELEPGAMVAIKIYL